MPSPPIWPSTMTGWPMIWRNLLADDAREQVARSARREGRDQRDRLVGKSARDAEPQSRGKARVRRAPAVLNMCPPRSSGFGLEDRRAETVAPRLLAAGAHQQGEIDSLQITFLHSETAGGMDLLRSIESFVAIANRAVSPSAARHLRLTPSAVSKQIAALEAELGVGLVLRTTRELSLTNAGKEYLQRAKRIMTKSRGAQNAVRGHTRSRAGRCGSRRRRPSGGCMLRRPCRISCISIRTCMSSSASTTGRPIRSPPAWTSRSASGTCGNSKHDRGETGPHAARALCQPGLLRPLGHPAVPEDLAGTIACSARSTRCATPGSSRAGGRPAPWSSTARSAPTIPKGCAK